MHGKKRRSCSFKVGFHLSVCDVDIDEYSFINNNLSFIMPPGAYWVHRGVSPSVHVRLSNALFILPPLEGGMGS